MDLSNFSKDITSKSIAANNEDMVYMTGRGNESSGVGGKSIEMPSESRILKYEE